MFRPISLAALMLLLSPLAAIGQHMGRHGAPASNGTATAPPTEDPDVTGLKRSIAMQASDAQIAQFQEMTKSTQKAQQQALELEHADAQKLARGDLSTRTKALEDLVDDAQSDVRTFRRSLNDAQEAGLKKLIKKLEKSDSAVTKEASAISQRMEQGSLDRTKIASSIASLGKALAALQEDQSSIGKEIGIDSQQP